MFAEQGAHHAGGDAEQDERDSAADDRDILVGQDQILERSRALGQPDPEGAPERIEAEHVAECLGQAEQAGHHRQREIEQAGDGDAATVHREQGRARAVVRGDIDRDGVAAAGADMVT